jgi:hypothetical protein
VGALDLNPAGLEALLARHAPELESDLAGPFTVLSVSRSGPDVVRCELRASRLIPLEHTDPALHDVFVAVPVSGWVELRADGSIAGSELPRTAPEDEREARAFVRGLIERGAVRGLAPAQREGPPARPTHEIRTEAGGRRVLRRIGFSAG